MEKLCADQLLVLGKLVAFFRKADPDKFDTVVAEARKYLEAEQKQAKRTDLEKLAEAVSVYCDRGYGVCYSHELCVGNRFPLIVLWQDVEYVPRRRRSAEA